MENDTELFRRLLKLRWVSGWVLSTRWNFHKMFVTINSVFEKILKKIYRCKVSEFDFFWKRASVIMGPGFFKNFISFILYFLRYYQKVCFRYVWLYYVKPVYLIDQQHFHSKNMPPIPAQLVTWSRADFLKWCPLQLRSS